MSGRFKRVFFVSITGWGQVMPRQFKVSIWLPHWQNDDVIVGDSSGICQIGRSDKIGLINRKIL
jgi:hypothetical protein